MDLEWNSLQKDIDMYNIDENVSEDCVKTVLGVLIEKFKVHRGDLKSQFCF